MRPALVLIGAGIALSAAADPPAIRFEDVTEAAGVAFTHTTRSFGERHKAQVLEMFTDGGAAVAVGDYDGDGHDDLFVTDSGEGRPNRLYRNLHGETGELRFAEVAAAAGVAGGNDPHFVVADALWLDFDDDGRLDLLVARFGTPLLYRNSGASGQADRSDGGGKHASLSPPGGRGTEGEGGAPDPGARFREVSAAAGLTTFANTIAVIAFDYDGDGWLDLLLGNYFPPRNLLDLDTDKVLPNDLDGADNGGGVSLWRNVAGGSTETGGRAFVEVTAEAGLAHHTGWSLDLGHADLDGDGDQDVYVAGDYGTDRLFVNRGDGTFEDVTERALGRLDTKKGMNVDVADYDRDGLLDVYVTNITDEYMRECNMLWHNQGAGDDGLTFLDLSAETGTCDTDWGWAAKFADLDNDGWEDLFVVNGLRSAGPENYIPLLVETIVTPGIDFSDLDSYPDIGDRTWSGYQPQRLFRNLGDGTFREMAAKAGVGTDADGRGIGVGDLDSDGRLDLYQSNVHGPSFLFRNVTEGAGHWIGLRLEGAGAAAGGSNRRAIGARVTVTTKGGERYLREVTGGNGYASQSTTTLHFGLGRAEAVERIEIRWPRGRTEVLEAKDGRPPVPLDTVTTIAEGQHDRLQQHRNLGKALYENPATQYEAVPEFEAALALAPDSARERVNLGLALLRAGEPEKGVAQLLRAQEQDPSIPHTWFNLGIAYKKAGDYEKAVHQLEGMLERVPEEPITHYNLGVLYKLEGEPEKAVRHFERAAELDPNLAGPHFQLATAYRQAGRAEDAAAAMERFRELKARDAGAAVQEDLEWSWYAEIYDPVEPEPRPAPAAEVRFEAREVAGGLDARSEGGTAGLEVLEADADPEPELLAWSAQGVRLLFLGTEAEPGLGGLRGVRQAAAGDFDDDGLHDLAVLAGERVLLLTNRGGRFEAVEGLPEAAGRAFDRALWLDFDHDYDLDLLLFGAEPALLRNDGDGSWSDRTGDFPFEALAGGGRVTGAARFDLVADTQGIDVAVARESGAGVLFRDLLGGRYEAVPLPELPAGTRELLAADVDHDGWTDLVAGTDGSVTVLRNRHRFERHEGFEAVTVSDSAGAPLALLDLENRGAADLVAGGRILRDRGRLQFQSEPHNEEGGTSWEAAGLPSGPLALAAADFELDGRTDLAAVTAEGAVLLLRNTTDTPHRSLRVTLAGVKNPKLAPGAEVEVKAGSLYQKKLYHGVPLVFGLAGHETADAVRITWPNGLIQNETRQPAGTAVTYEEAQRLSGSCPMIFTWNGEGFEFITDVLGVAPLGASAGDGEYFPTDHDEVIQIPAEALTETADGRYEVRITEELREVAYLDRVRLLAVDHPAEIDVFTNDKFKGPPFPEFRLYGVERAARRPPLAARDHHGRDVLPRLLARDETYPDGFRRDYSGLAEMHWLELDFGAGAGDLLVLSGWVDWADGSTFLASAQGSGPGLVLPYLQVKDEAGEWVTVIEDMGIPAGKPKTIVVDLTGNWLSASREVRIVTSACVYWDEIFLAEEALDCLPDAPDSLARTSCRPERSEAQSRDLGGGAPPITLAEVPAIETHLRFRGFSRPVIHPERKQPERFVYADRRPTTLWNPTPGLYTRYGDVAELLARVDDRFVVMGSGDEVRLSFDARALPPPAPGRRRSFLLWVDGWAKDGDANTAHSQTVQPLPYHGMPQYPYEPPHAYPDTPEHRRYVEEYLTRPALRLIRPLTEGTAADPRRADR